MALDAPAVGNAQVKRSWPLPLLVLFAHALLFGDWIVDDAGITFVGPPAEALASLGDKAQAKAAMISPALKRTPRNATEARNMFEALFNRAA